MFPFQWGEIKEYEDSHKASFEGRLSVYLVDNTPRQVVIVPSDGGILDGAQVVLDIDGGRGRLRFIKSDFAPVSNEVVIYSDARPFIEVSHETTIHQYSMDRLTVERTPIAASLSARVGLRYNGLPQVQSLALFAGPGAFWHAQRSDGLAMEFVTRWYVIGDDNQ